MNENTYYLLTAVVALAAIVVSIISAMISRTNVITTAISTNRIEWISAVRELIFEFLSEYRSESPDKKKLGLLSTHIMLYLNRRNDDYILLVSALQKCLDTGYTDALYADLVDAAQDVLNSVWLRMKREAGIRKWHEIKISNSIKKERKANVHCDKFSNAMYKA